MSNIALDFFPPYLYSTVPWEASNVYKRFKCVNCSMLNTMHHAENVISHLLSSCPYSSPAYRVIVGVHKGGPNLFGFFTLTKGHLIRASNPSAAKRSLTPRKWRHIEENQKKECYLSPMPRQTGWRWWRRWRRGQGEANQRHFYGESNCVRGKAAKFGNLENSRS